ncbi:MAG: sulfite exporter TauE/SafE family protein [Actinomycetia bacterium]|nr:sulfite exporter TauE/SafE family protein [Actinomycetes bacterium]
MLEIIGLILLGVFAGSLAATLGVGGGIIFVPALVALFAFDQLEAQGTSLAIIVMTAIVGTVTHARAGRVDWKVVAVVGSSGIIAAFGAATLAQSMNEDLLRKVFAIVLALLAVRMGLRTYRLWKTSSVVDSG